jgi:hypothetical protein
MQRVTRRRWRRVGALAVAQLVVLCYLACEAKSKPQHEPQPLGANQAPLSEQPSANQALSGEGEPAPTPVPAQSQAEHLANDGSEHDCSQHDGPPHVPPPGASTAALNPKYRAELTTIRVSAHAGSVTVRRQGSKWVTAGTAGCAVPTKRIEAALDNLTALTATPSQETAPVGTPFVLQIDVLMGERHAVHLEVADHEGGGDFVRLLDDSSVIVQGIDRQLWSPDPAVWCRDLQGGNTKPTTTLGSNGTGIQR